MRLTRGTPTGHISTPWDLYAVSLRTGKKRQVTDLMFVQGGNPGDVSPDGRHAIVTATCYTAEAKPPKHANGLFLIDLKDGSVVRRFGSTPGHLYRVASFSRDGRHVLSGEDRGGTAETLTALVSFNTETGEYKQLLSHKAYPTEWCWFRDPRPSPDGKKILFLMMKCPASEDSRPNHKMAVLDLNTKEVSTIKPDWESVVVLPGTPSDELHRSGPLRREARIVAGGTCQEDPASPR